MMKMSVGDIAAIVMIVFVAGILLMAAMEKTPPPTPAQQARQKLQYCDLVLADKPISELTQRDLDKLRECRTLRMLQRR